jgi:hypothetical protein
MARLPHTMIRMKPVSGVGFLAGFNGGTQALKPAKELERPINANICFPSASTGVESNANKSGLVSHGNRQVSPIFPSGNVAQIGNSIVCPVSVDVVNMPHWRRSVDPFPYNPMGGRLLPSKMARLVSVSVGACESGSACIPSVKHAALLLWRPNPSVKVFWEGVIPSKVARCWAIVKKISNGASGHNLLQWLIPKRNTYNRGVQHVR